MITTYRFTTIQQLVDRVPADRILDCCTELGLVLSAAKSAAECLLQSQNPKPESVITLPLEMEWVDDGKEKLEARLDVNGKPLVTVSVEKVKEVEK